MTVLKFDRHAVVVAAVALCLWIVSGASAQLRIVNYNTYKHPDSSSQFSTWTTILAAMGDTQPDGIAKPVDIMALQEVPYDVDTAQNIANLLNNYYGVNTYIASTSTGGDGFNHQAYVYNSATVTLGSTANIYLGTRPTYRAFFQPVGYTSPDAGFYMYNVHLKAYSGEQTRRANEATNLRNNGDALGPNANIIYTGDFNLADGLTEPAYTIMTAPGDGQGIDPLNGAYGSSLVDTYSSSGPYSRIDFQFVSNRLDDGQGLDLVPGSYHTFGLSPYGSSYTIDPVELSYASQASDHLPVMADYQLPAVMSASVSGDNPLQVVFVNAPLNATVNVQNVADVVAANGADVLDYQISSSLFAGGSVTGSAAPLASANVHQIALDTSTAGYFTGSVTIHSDDPGTQNPTATQNVQYVVLQHATGSFDSDSPVTSITLDLGTITQDTGSAAENFDLWNLAAAGGFTAQLIVGTPVPVSGDTAVLGLANQSGQITAGDSLTQTALFDLAAVGDFSATWRIPVSDPDYAGAISGWMDVTLTGQVQAPAPSFVLGDFDLNGSLTNGDIQAMLDALTDLAGYKSAHGLSDADLLAVGDIDGSGSVTNGDIQSLLDLLTGSSASASGEIDTPVPEPASLGLMMLGGLALIRRRRSIHHTLN